MPEHTFEVGAYDLDLNTTLERPARGIRLEDERGDSTAFLNFYPEGRLRWRAETSVADGGASVVVDAPLSEFEPYYRVLGTEKPVYCYADYEESGGPLDAVASFGLATDLEMVGEGFEDVTP